MEIKYCPYCGKSLEEECECARIAYEEKMQFIEDYENDEMVQYGWHMQDVIDRYRMEQ